MLNNSGNDTGSHCPEHWLWLTGMVALARRTPGSGRAEYSTAKADSESGVRGLRDGAEDYIVKPFEMVALLVRIEKVLARTGSHPCFQNHRGVLHDGNHPARFRGGRKHRGAKDCRTMVDQYSGGVCGYCNYCDRNCRDKVHPYDADEGMRRRSCPVKNGCIEQVTATDTKAEVISCQKQAHILL